MKSYFLAVFKQQLLFTKKIPRYFAKRKFVIVVYGAQGVEKVECH